MEKMISFGKLFNLFDIISLKKNFITSLMENDDISEV